MSGAWWSFLRRRRTVLRAGDRSKALSPSTLTTTFSDTAVALPQRATQALHISFEPPLPLFISRCFSEMSGSCFGSCRVMSRQLARRCGSHLSRISCATIEIPCATTSPRHFAPQSKITSTAVEPTQINRAMRGSRASTHHVSPCHAQPSRSLSLCHAAPHVCCARLSEPQDRQSYTCSGCESEP
ncbi:hypothetical protein HDK90DRAFT_153645 [Phyllosticta capitalensis]|uniref:Uncharacterized protein n=1 Tax=Phyllosticta capitalensis TaxID=121624 RepID=A0ABR1Z058_9PEZI